MQLNPEKESTSSISGFSTLSAQRIIWSLSEHQCPGPLSETLIQFRYQYFLTFCRRFHCAVRIKSHWFAFKYDMIIHRFLGLIQCYPGWATLIWKSQIQNGPKSESFVQTDMMPQVKNSTPAGHSGACL